MISPRRTDNESIVVARLQPSGWTWTKQPDLTSLRGLQLLSTPDLASWSLAAVLVERPWRGQRSSCSKRRANRWGRHSGRPALKRTLNKADSYRVLFGQRLVQCDRTKEC